MLHDTEAATAPRWERLIRGIHGLLYSTDPEATRAFFRDVLKLPNSDIGEGWLIFDFKEGDLGVHPVNDPGDEGLHAISFVCDDIRATVADLRSRGARFTQEIQTREYGYVTEIAVPGGITVQLYEPRYAKPKARPSRGSGSPSRSGTRGRGKSRST